MSPELFFAACAVVVVLIVWLFWAMRSYKAAATSFQEACRIHKDRADAIGHDRRSVADELVKQQDETQKARRERNSAREERDRLAENEAEVVAANKEMHQRLEAAAARPVLAVTTKASQRGRVRVQIRENDDMVLLQSPAGYGSQDKADAIVERLCGSRLEKAE